MSTISCTIGGSSVTVLNNPFSDASTLEMRDILTFTVIDASGVLTFQRGQPVIFSDSVTGVLYSGYVASDKPQKLSPDPSATTVLHAITCMDKQYLADKRSNSANYANWYAGDIVVDMARNGALASEGIGIAAALRHESATSDFDTGTLNGTTGSTATPTNDGDLELAKAGSDTTITVNLGSGTYNNAAYSGGLLSPTLTATAKLTTSLVTSAGQNSIYVKIWSGSQAIATNDQLIVDIWVPDTNKEISATLDVTFSDGTRMDNGSVADVYDQNYRPSFSFSGTILTDISAYAKDQWYHRIFTFPSAYNGKTAVAVHLGIGGTSPGTFTAYYKNITLSGTTIFSSSFQTTPVVDHGAGNFLANATSVTLVQTYDPAPASYISSANSIDVVKLIRSTSLLWTDQATSTAAVNVNASYDGNSYLACTNMQALPSLPAGSNVAGTNLYFKVTWSPGSDPTLFTSLTSLMATLVSAPNATKSDVIASYGTQASLNTGTYTNTQGLSNGDLTISTYTRNWNDNTISNQTLFQTGGTVTESASTGAYTQTMGTGGAVGISRLDFAGNEVDFTLDCDVKVSATGVVQTGIVYRTVGWTNTANAFGYLVSMDTGQIQFGYGSNTNTGSNSYTQLATVAQSLSTNTYYHVKIVVVGNLHLIYFNNSSTPTINIIDNTYTTPGGFGLRGFSATTGSVHTWDNLVINPSSSGTWVSPSTSISSLGTIEGSVIAWQEVNTSNATTASVAVSTSIDGGSTYQACTNGATIPGLTSGTNVSGKSVLVKATLSTQTSIVSPIIRGLIFRVLGQYSSSGTRSTAPYGIDNMVRANQSGWGTAQDTQSWTKTGTGTDAISSNEGTITNTTGDVHERLGSTTGTDEEGTVRFQLSASTMQAGMELRYSDSSHYYRLAASTTALSIIKNVGAGNSTLASASVTLSTGTWYWLRFRVTGSSPVSLWGKVWPDGQIEPGVSNGIMSSTAPQWTVSASD